MLKILGDQHRFCNGLGRRSFIRIGGLALGGLGLPQLLRAEASLGIRSSNKSVIMIYLPGGPPHQDMFDLKPDAPSDVRGEFRPIRTRVEGIEICEHLPRIAANMDKLVVIRSLVGSEGAHDSFQCLTGHTRRGPGPQGGWPEYGCAISGVLGPTGTGAPPYVNLFPKMQHRPYNAKGPGFLGMPHAPFMPEGDTKADMVLNGVSTERLGDRRRLLAGLDSFRRHLDSSDMMRGMDSFQQRAFEILTSSRLARALDLAREDPRVRERYGHGTMKRQGDAAPRLMGQFLVARRLIEAGVRCVSVSFSFWDWHGQNFRNARENLPDLDQGVSALLEDLHQRGLHEDVTVIVWGEFGRTPKINNNAGRDHWPRVCGALLAGGGMRTGQVIGATTRDAGEAKERPVHFSEVFATLYHNLGIDTRCTTVPDLAGRPQYLVADAAPPIQELI